MARHLIACKVLLAVRDDAVCRDPLIRFHNEQFHRLAAARIREAAAQAGIPIFSDPPTARALHATVEVGEAIDREHFAAVAAAVRFARALSGRDET